MRMKRLEQRQAAMRERTQSVSSPTAVATNRKHRGPSGCMDTAVKFLLANKDTYFSNTDLARMFGMSVYTARSVRYMANLKLKAARDNA